MATDPSVSPAMVFEGLLFVGHPGGEPVTVEQCSAVLRGWNAADFQELAESLNEVYRRQGRPYHVERLADGYRLALTAEFARLRDQLQSRTRRARLSRAALEILSLVAYGGPLTGEQISERCGAAASGVLRQLVRRNLLAVSRPSGARGPRSYRTTDRFLEVFRLDSLAELPRSQDLDQADHGL
jgi:segregation and condensation protein B